MRVEWTRLGETVWMARCGERVAGYVGLDAYGYVAFDSDMRPLTASDDETTARAAIRCLPVFARDSSPAPGPDGAVADERDADPLSRTQARVRGVVESYVREHWPHGVGTAVDLVDPDLSPGPVAVRLNLADGGVVVIDREPRGGWCAVFEPPAEEIRADADALIALSSTLDGIAELCRRLDRLA